MGYGGTKNEMQRLIADANKVREANGEMANLSIESFADIVVAIETMQDKMGISGTTAREAGTTIEGSINSMKSAWQNLITGLADGNADIGQLVDNLVTTIVGDGTEGNLGVLGNIMPAIKTALNGASKLIKTVLPIIIEELPDILTENLPALAEAAVSIIKGLVSGISTNKDSLFQTVVDLIKFFAESIISLLPDIISLGLDLIISLANGIAESLPELLPSILEVIMEIVRILTEDNTLSRLVSAAIAIIRSLGEFLTKEDTINNLLDAVLAIVDTIVTILMENLEPLLDAAIAIIMAIVDYLLTPENILKLVQTAVEIVVKIAGALVGAAGEITKAAGELIYELFQKFKETDWKEIGKNILQGIKNGIKNAWADLKDWFSGLFDDLIGIAKKILGIASPSKVFKKIGGFTAEGFGAGFDDEFAHVKDDMEDALNFDDASFGINASIRKLGAGAAGGAFGGTSIGSITINIDGANYQDEQSLAEAIAEAIQGMTDRRSAVYA